VNDPDESAQTPLVGAATPKESWPHLQQLHHELDSVAGLFAHQHYDEAVRKAAQRFANRVKELTNRSDLDGTALMEQAFSAKEPLLAFSDRENPTERNEHDGFRSLAVGMYRALRNVLSHTDSYGFEEVTAQEWLIFISAMHRRLDQVQQVAAA